MGDRRTSIAGRWAAAVADFSPPRPRDTTRVHAVALQLAARVDEGGEIEVSVSELAAVLRIGRTPVLAALDTLTAGGLLATRRAHGAGRPIRRAVAIDGVTVTVPKGGVDSPGPAWERPGLSPADKRPAAGPSKASVVSNGYRSLSAQPQTARGIGRPPGKPPTPEYQAEREAFDMKRQRGNS